MTDLSSKILPERILTLQDHYRSGTGCDLGNDFFLPCLAECKEYYRAAGYFTSSVLRTWASVLPRFSEVESVHIRLLVSPQLQEEDVEALTRTTTPESRELILQKTADEMVLTAVKYATDTSDRDRRLDLLSWFVATGRLELRFAFAHHHQNPMIFRTRMR